MKELQRICGRVRKALTAYDMISAGDVVAVGVSGGKDSLALLCALAELRSYYPVPFSLVAITVDPSFEKSKAIAGAPSDWSKIASLCEAIAVPYHVERTDIAPIVFDARREDNPCSLCSKLRRGALIGVCERVGANVLALGHHADDAAETALMNLFYEGRFGCFSPVTEFEDRSLRVIRPAILCSEREIASYARKAELPVTKSQCPMDESSVRAATKERIRSLDREIPGVQERIVGALCRGEIDGWKEI